MSSRDGQPGVKPPAAAAAAAARLPCWQMYCTAWSWKGRDVSARVSYDGNLLKYDGIAQPRRVENKIVPLSSSPPSSFSSFPCALLPPFSCFLFPFPPGAAPAGGTTTTTTRSSRSSSSSPKHGRSGAAAFDRPRLESVDEQQAVEEVEPPLGEGGDTAPPHGTDVHMDAMAFGMGCCCLQVTFQVCEGGAEGAASDLGFGIYCTS